MRSWPWTQVQKQLQNFLKPRRVFAALNSQDHHAGTPDKQIKIFGRHLHCVPRDQTFVPAVHGLVTKKQFLKLGGQAWADSWPYLGFTNGRRGGVTRGGAPGCRVAGEWCWRRAGTEERTIAEWWRGAAHRDAVLQGSGAGGHRDGGPQWSEEGRRAGMQVGHSREGRRPAWDPIGSRGIGRLGKGNDLD